MDIQHNDNLDLIFDDARRPGEVAAAPSCDQPVLLPATQKAHETVSRAGALAARGRCRAGPASPAPHELSFVERINTGFVNPGWQPAQWAARLIQLAGRCEQLRPNLADDYRHWAANVERRLGKAAS